jgi:hypothetical protein
MTRNLTGGSPSRLPAAFAELEPYVPMWALEDAAQRANTRANSSIDELREFYSAMLSVAADAAEALRGTPVEALDEQHVVLLKLLLSLAEVAVGVECFGAPSIPYGYDQARLVRVPVPNMTPVF